MKIPRSAVVVALLLFALLMGATSAIWPGGHAAAVAAEKVAAPCPQWEVMLGQATRVTIDAKSLPEAGKAIVEQAPPGWEPFAFTPAGQLVYRRCAK